MTFEKWLQFVFIPKMSEIVNTQSRLPKKMHLLPMAEQRFGTADSQSGYMQTIKQIDLIFAIS
jgi:uncharacterized protein YqcC (DUF446 family)